jgi:hypothetical protein
MINLARALAAATTFVRNERWGQCEHASQRLTAARSEYSKALRAAVVARDKIFDHAHETTDDPSQPEGYDRGDFIKQTHYCCIWTVFS